MYSYWLLDFLRVFNDIVTFDNVILLGTIVDVDFLYLPVP